jgi:AraC family transcriptional activator FtrA
MFGKKTSFKGAFVAAVACEPLCTFELGCVVELFSLPRPELETSWYQFGLCAKERRLMRAEGGFLIRIPHSLGLIDRADIVIIPGWRNVDDTPPAALLQKLRRAHDGGARICSICSGAFVLAAAGLLDGRAATTHWRYAGRLQNRYPSIDVRANELYVDEGSIITSAGSAAGLDMLLHMVRRDYGSRIANVVAQRLVIAPHRDGGQAQFLPRPIPPDPQNPLGVLLQWIRANPAVPHNLSSLARRARMSPRTLQRHFLQATGLSPLQWVVRERVAMAKELLENTTAPLWKVCETAGFTAEETFRRHFRLVTGTSPYRYRQRFGQRPAIM